MRRRSVWEVPGSKLTFDTSLLDRLPPMNRQYTGKCWPWNWSYADQPAPCYWEQEMELSLNKFTDPVARILTSYQLIIMLLSSALQNLST